jgi:hypothetical protein
MSDRDYDPRKIKDSLIFYKKYFKFYKNNFVPITKHEQKDREYKLRNFEILRIFSFCLGALFLNTFKKLRITLKMDPLKTTASLKSRTLAENLFTTFSSGALGFLVGHCFGLKFLFDQTEYIRLRYYYEKSIGFERKPSNKLEEDYPFANKVPYLKNDIEVKHKFTTSDRRKDVKIKSKDKQTQPGQPEKSQTFGEDAVIERRVGSFSDIKELVFSEDLESNTGIDITNPNPNSNQSIKYVEKFDGSINSENSSNK